MKKLLIFVILSAFIFGEDLTGRQVITNMVSANGILISKMNIKLIDTDYKNGKEKVTIRELTRYHKNYQDGIYSSKSLLRFSKPDIIKNTGFLIWAKRNGGNEQWLFLPKVNSARKIEAKEKTRSFMNTEFAFEDLESFNQSDEQYFLIEKSEFEGNNCYIVEIIRHSNTQYKKRIVWIDDQNWYLRKVEFFDKNNKLIKILQVSDYYTAGDYSYPQKMTMTNKQNEANTVMQINDIDFDVDLPDDFFTEANLINP